MKMRELKANLEESQSKLKELEKSKKKMPEDHVREMEEMKKKIQQMVQSHKEGPL